MNNREDEVPGVELIKGTILPVTQAWKVLDDALMTGVRDNTSSLAARAMYDALSDMPVREYHTMLKAVVRTLHQEGVRFVQIEDEPPG